MTLEHYWSLLTRQWKFIVACTIVVGLGTFIGSKLMTPIYQSTTLVRVNVHNTDNSADYNNLLASNQLVQTEAVLATSSPVLQEVASRYPGLTSDLLASKTTATPRLNTQLFDINVQDASAIRAAALANDIANILIIQQVQLAGQQNAQSQLQLQQDSDKTNQSINDLSKKIGDAELKIASLATQKGAQASVATLQIQITGLQDQLNSLQQHYIQDQMLFTQLEMSEAQNRDFLQVAQSAQPGHNPVRPQVLLNTLLGFGGGLFLALMIALFFEQLDTRVRTPKDIAQVFNWPILGITWLVEPTKNEEEALINPKTQSINAESYRMLRTNIGFLAAAHPVHSLVVTSAMPHEGKTTIASNLAIFMAKAGKNTLLIDADMHRPTFCKKFSLAKDAKGLTDAIVACSQHLTSLSPTNPEFPSDFFNPYMHQVNIPHLRVIPAGPFPPDPAELLDSAAMNHFLATITKSGIEVIIFDTPPILGLAYTSTLAAKVDGTLLVIDVSRGKKKNLQQAKAQLQQSGTRILGCIVNKQRHNNRDVPYYYYNQLTEEEQETHVSHNGHNAIPTPTSLSFAEKGQIDK